jgi:hypothetical protein
MKIPYRPHSFIKVKKPHRYIIIHDTGTDITNEAEMVLDNASFQIGKLRAQNMVLNGEFDLNYHFVVEKIKDDYETLFGRPLNAICEYDDIVAPYDASIHVAVMGNYNFDIPDDRMYKQLAYRVLGPMMTFFRIDRSRILLHSEVSDDQPECPGTNFNKERLMSYVRTLVIPR